MGATRDPEVKSGCRGPHPGDCERRGPDRLLSPLLPASSTTPSPRHAARARAVAGRRGASM
eukprot:9244973-Pyramimonas_sp.AAC.3